MANDLSSRDSKLPLPQPAFEPSQVEMRQMFELLRAGKWLIASVALSFVLIGGLYWILIPPTFEADGLVQVEDDSKTGSSSDLGQISSLLLGTPVETEAEIEVLQSRLVLIPVIDKMNLLIDATPKHFPIFGAAVARFNADAEEPVSAIWGLRRYAWGGEDITIDTLTVPPHLLEEEMTLRNGETAGNFELIDPDGKLILKGTVGHEAKNAKGTVSILVSSIVARPGTEFRLTAHDMQQKLVALVNRLKVEEEGKQSGVIKLTFKGKSASFVTEFINNLEASYLKQNVERRSADAQKSLEFLSDQLPKLKEQLNLAQARLSEYQQAHGQPDVTTETQLLLQNAVDLQTQRLSLTTQRDQALQRFTKDHPVVRSLDDQIRTVQEAEKDLQKRTDKLPATQQDVLNMLRDLDANTDLYTAMMNSIQELQVAKAGTIGNVRIVDSAIKPFRKYSPKGKYVFPIALVLGLFFGVALVFVQRAMLRGVDDPAEVESHFGLTTYASVPYSAAQRQLSGRMRRGDSEHFILAASDASNVAIEALRSLRTSLHFALIEAPNNVVMLTGPTPGLGKSFITINLGAVLALSGKRVVVVDGDLRRGRLNDYVKGKASPGISDYVAGDAKLADIVRRTPVDGLHLITRGTTPPNPAELLLNERFGAMIKALSADHDFVLIDSPPVLAVTDAAILGRLAGCTLVVLKAAEHPIREIEEVLKRLSNGGVQVKGILFNQVGARVGSYGYGSYGYNYYQDYGSR